MMLRRLAVVVLAVFVCPILAAQDPFFVFQVTDAAENYDPDDGEATLCVELSIQGVDDPDATTGFDMVLTYDSDLVDPDTLETATVLSDLNGGTGPDYYYVDVLTVDDGTAVVGVLTIEIVYDNEGVETIDFDDAETVFDLCFVTNADTLIGDTDGAVTELEFSDDLDGVSLDNDVASEGEPLPVEFVGSTITLTSVDFYEYVYTANPLTIAYDEDSGEGWANVVISIEENPLGPDYPQVTYGFSMSLDWDDTILDAFEVLPAGLLLEINDGNGADYFESDMTLDDGMVLGVIYSQSLDTSHSFEVRADVVQISFETVPSAFDEEAPESTEIEWVDGLGVSSIDNEVILIDRAASVQLVDGEIDFLATSGRFIRGDADGNGSVFGLIDALFLLEFGFTNGPAPPCERAGDADDNEVLFPILDSIYLLNWQFVNGPAPAPPGPFRCGVDGTPVGDLSCEEECT